MAKLKLEIVIPGKTVEEVKELVIEAGIVSRSLAEMSEIDAIDVAAAFWGENEGFGGIVVVVNELVEGDE